MAAPINRNKETILLITAITAVLVMAAIIHAYYKNLPPPASFPPAEASASQDQKEKGKNDADHARLDRHEKNMLRVALIENIMRKSMRNPDSFKMESAIVPPSGAVCMEYSAQNGFGAIYL